MSNEAIAMNCPACRSDGNFLTLGKESAEFRLGKCGDCGLVFTRPMPQDEVLIRYYQGFKFEPPDPASLSADIEAISESLALLCGGKRGRFLDFGGGCGIYAAAAHRLGFEATLFDVDASGIAFAESELGLECCISRFEDLSGEFDVVLSFHVIEHSNDLDRDFQRLVRLLAPGGCLVIATPNNESVEKYVVLPMVRNYVRRLRAAGAGKLESWARVLSPDSILCWDPPRHLYALNRRSLDALARRHGLEGKTFCPYNTDKRFEPRQYTLPRMKSLAAWRAEAPQARRGPVSLFRWLARHFVVSVVRGGVALLSRCFPDRGGQAYGIFHKPASPRESSAA